MPSAAAPSFPRSPPNGPPQVSRLLTASDKFTKAGGPERKMGVKARALAQTFSLWARVGQTLLKRCPRSSGLFPRIWEPGSRRRGRRQAGLGHSGPCPRSRKHGLQEPAHNSGVLWEKALPLFFCGQSPQQGCPNHINKVGECGGEIAPAIRSY